MKCSLPLLFAEEDNHQSILLLFTVLRRYAWGQNRISASGPVLEQQERKSKNLAHVPSAPVTLLRYLLFLKQKPVLTDTDLQAAMVHYIHIHRLRILHHEGPGHGRWRGSCSGKIFRDNVIWGAADERVSRAHAWMPCWLGRCTVPEAWPLRGAV